MVIMRKIMLWLAVLAVFAFGTGAALLANAPAQATGPDSVNGPVTAGIGSPPGCFGHRGIQITGFIAYECLAEPAGLGGALYWSVNESDINWDKHPGAGLLWVEASTLHPAPDAKPVNSYQDFWVGIARAGGAFCTVINPGYDQHPTQCEHDGITRTMSTRQQDSYNQFIASLRASGIPTCAWSQTVTADEAACDIDS